MCPFADCAVIRVEWQNGTWYQLLVNDNGIFEYLDCTEPENPKLGVVRREIASYIIHDMLSGPIGYEKDIGTPAGSAYHWTFCLRRNTSDSFHAEGYSNEPAWRHDLIAKHLAFLSEFTGRTIQLP